MIKKTTANRVLFSSLLILVLFTLLTPIGFLKAKNQTRRAGSRETVTPVSPPLKEVVESKTRQPIIENYGKLPMTFEANEGQTDGQVKFLSRGSSYSLFLTSTESVLVLRKSVPQERQLQLSATQLKGLTRPTELNSSERAIVRMQLVGVNPRARLEGLEELPGKSNYFIGNDPRKWRTNVRTYAKVHYPNVYPGIDQIYYGNQGKLEYDLVVAPGSDPKSIALGFQGVDRLEVDFDGDLILKTSIGIIRQQKPIAYQNIAGVRREISAGYVLKGKHQVGFHVAAYDASEPLVIDPALIYSTFLGGSGGEGASDIAVDPAGNTYVTGGTASLNFPTTAGAYQTALGGNIKGDAFVVKLNSTGSALVYSTYLGGSDYDQGNGIAVDTVGNAYVTGNTTCTISNFHCVNNFPTTPGAFQTTFGGANSDGFVVKLDPTGSGLIYSTYLGGLSDDLSQKIAVDAAGNAYMTGTTSTICCGAAFPTTAGAFQTTVGNGCGDAFVTKLNPNGSGLVYSTYLGGNGNDVGFDIAVDNFGDAYVTGITTTIPSGCSTSPDSFPTTNGAFQTALAGGDDAFVVKLNPTGSGLDYSTLLGGGNDDVAIGITLDGDGNAYVTGATGSASFPTTAGAFQTTYGGGSRDGFVAKLNPTGAALVYSTYIGGSDFDLNSAIAVDGAGNTYLTGNTFSTNFPTIVGAFQPIFGGGVTDAFLAKLNSTGSALVYSTFLGGFGNDSGSGIAVDLSPNPNAYVTGSACCNFPTTSGAFQSSSAGAEEAFVTKLDATAPPPTPTPTPGVGPPTNKDQCKNYGWQTFNVPRAFKNQGDCIQFVNTGK